MSKHCETFDHPADVGLAATADTLGELFEALAEGLADVICPRRQVQARDTRPLAVEAEDVEALAVDFLSAVMVLMQTDRFMASQVCVKDISPAGVRAEVRGEPYDPARHEIDTEVKAVTYHQLKIAQDGPVWTGRVLLDL